MRVSYDKVDARYMYPLDQEDVRAIMDYVPPAVAASISHIRFGCNLKTKQEGRVVQRGSDYEIRVNFCVWKSQGNIESRLLSKSRKSYIQDVRRHGGRPNLDTITIAWDMASAKRYAAFVLLHEVGHVAYLQTVHGQEARWEGSSREERWCDGFSNRLVKKMARGQGQ